MRRNLFLAYMMRVAVIEFSQNIDIYVSKIDTKIVVENKEDGMKYGKEDFEF